MKVGSIAVGCSGNKRETLDLTVVAIDELADLEAQLTTAVAAETISHAMSGTVRRDEMPELLD